MKKKNWGFILFCMLSVSSLLLFFSSQIMGIFYINLGYLSLTKSLDSGAGSPARFELNHHSAKQFQTALRWVQDHDAAHIGLAQSHLYRGKARLPEQDPTLTFEQFDEAIRLAPNALFFYRQIGDFLLENREDDGYAYILQMVEDAPNAIQASETIQLLLGKTHWLLGNRDEANDIFAQLLSHRPTAKRHLDLSAFLFSQNAVKEALSICLSAPSATQMQNPGVLICQGEAFWQLGDYEQAAEAFLQAHSILPTNGTITHWLARTYSRLGAYDESIHFGEKSIASDPTNVWYIAQVGNVYLLLGDKVAAGDAYRRALALEPENQVIQQYLQDLEP